jgi:hypothetical protein
MRGIQVDWRDSIVVDYVGSDLLGNINHYQDKISQDCPDCGNRVLAIRINGFYAGSRDRIFLWECPLCESVWKKLKPKLKVEA